MKGIILAGGKGTRLYPLTRVTSKQLLPVYDRQMIFYPLNTLVRAGIKEILIITTPDHQDQFKTLLGDGSSYGIQLSYAIQERANGLAEAFIIGESFIEDDDVTLILGDNIFEEDFTESIQGFEKGARIFAKEVPDPERFGVVEFDTDGSVLSIEEKPKEPKSAFAITGLYVYDNRVVSFAKQLKPSARGEFEIVDLHALYLERDELDVRTFSGIWEDAGTFESLLRAGELARDRLSKSLIL